MPEDYTSSVVCGLENIGNTCYLNSGIQCLCNTSSFVIALRIWWKTMNHKTSSSKSLSMKTCVLRDLVDLFSTMESGTHLQMAPRALLRSLSSVYSEFEGFHQQDCPEMLNVVISTIDDCTHFPIRVSNLPNSPRFIGNGKCLNIYDFMKEVNDENARKEQQIAAAKGKQVSPFFAPLIFHSGVTDLFKGYTLNEITCGNCGEVSRVIDAFSSLAIEIPSTTQRLAFAKQYPELVPTKSSDSSAPQQAKRERYWWNPIRVFSIFSTVAKWMFSSEPAIEYPLTLNECIGVHFMCESLGGSNMYKCDACSKKAISTKKLSILKLPQELLVQIKRFEYGGYWTHKRSDSVAFPVDYDLHTSDDDDKELSTHVDVLSHFKKNTLDLSPFMHAVTYTDARESTHYALHSTATHHGTFGGGHYTAYANKGKESGWVLCNDHRLQPVEAEEVRDSQSYVLMFSRRRPQSLDDATEKCQRIAREYLANDNSDNNEEPRCFLSRIWLMQCALVLDPGCILNKMAYTESAPQYSPSEFYVAMPQSDGKYLHTVWHGDLPLTQEEYDAL